MERLFLYRLLKHSKWGFAFTIIFMLCYALTYYKKMDMIFFPYNSMYAIDFTKTESTTTYAMKINSVPVRITEKLYWKKDMLETSLNGYCRYLKNGKHVFLFDYVHYRFSNEQLQQWLLSNLTPVEKAVENWPAWYAAMAGYSIPGGATIEFVQYDLVLDKDRALLKDSIGIYKIIQP
ncbi:hypothetical protein BH11BAC4_BH11BAC4_23130 [soil metagenome]